MKRLAASKILIAVFAIVMAIQSAAAQKKDPYSVNIMNGISNNGQNRDKRYLTPGDRTYIVGTQDGNFPDLGSHVKGEMGGLWMHPIKLMDGFWVKLTDAASGSETWLKDAKEFINYPVGNKFVYAPVLNGIHVERFQYCPQGKEGIVIKYSIKNTTDKLLRLKMDFVVKTDVSPVWFSKENNIIDTDDKLSWVDDRSVFVARDVQNPWFAVWGSSLPVISHSTQPSTPVETIGMGKPASTTHQMEIKPNESVEAVFVISGSNRSLETAMSSYNDIFKNYKKLLTDKQAYYASIIDRAKIEIPDKKLQEAYSWGKINTEWLVSELPGIGRFLGAGAVEYPWLFGCDNSYALQGVVASGDLELAKSTLRVIKKVSENTNGNGRIIHEMSSNGFVENKGNTQETAHFAVAVWKVFEWTGDVAFLKEMYPYIKQGITWLLTEQDKNGNMFPEGYGIMEVKGLNAELIDVAVYTQQALDAATKMATIFKEPSASMDYAHKAAILKDKVNMLFWDETEGSYADFYGTREQAISTTQGAIEQIEMGIAAGKYSSNMLKKQEFYKELIKRLRSFPEGTQKGWFTNKNWVIITPVETGIAPSDKAVKLLNKVRNEHNGDFGPYLSAVDRTSMMTIATSVQAMAECAYGRTDEAMWYVDKIVQTFNRVLPGSISESMPDRGCPVQAWTIYGLASPLITHVYGISPDAHNKAVSFAPNLPSGWNDISISDLPIGNNTITFAVKKSEKAIEYKLSSKNADWKYMIKIKSIIGTKYVLNGKTNIATSDIITLYGKDNKLVVFRN